MNDKTETEKPKRKFLTPLKKGITGEEFAAWDVETEGLGGKLLAATWYITEDLKGYIAGSPRRIIAELFRVFWRYNHYIWMAHNAEYDWRYILDEIAEQGYSLNSTVRGDGRIMALEISVGKNKIRMRDSMALVPLSLEKFADAFAKHKKLKIDIENFDATNPEHIDYAINDSRILVEAMDGFNNLVMDHYGVSVGLSAASTAFRAFRKTLDKNYVRLSEECEEYIRMAYYGGMTILTSTAIHENVFAYDIKSSYPGQMLKGLPDGQCYFTKEYNEHQPGFWFCEVESPKGIIIPFIPTRVKNKTVWPVGKFDTFITSIEIEKAREHGYKINPVHGLVFEKLSYPCNDFVYKAIELRKLFRNQPTEVVAKLMQNSLYGKLIAKLFAQKLFIPSHKEETLTAKPFDEDGIFWLRVEEYDAPVMPHWGVWITANARMTLIDGAASVGFENVICGDTDSLKIINKQLPAHLVTDSVYGLFGKDNPYHYAFFRAHAPKVYAGIETDGRGNMKAKGIPQKFLYDKDSKSYYNEMVQAILDSAPFGVQYESLRGLKSAIKFNDFGLKPQTRTLTDLSNSVSFIEIGEQVRGRNYNDICKRLNA